jgi:hypothetical protein
MIDKHPALIVRCLEVCDVVNAIRFARNERLTVAVRSGGHSVAGYGVCDGGLVIDLSLMKRIWVEVDRCQARAEAGVTTGEFLSAMPSPRGDRSISRQLTRDFAAGWKQAHPEEQIIYRDLGHDPVPLVTETFIAAVYTPPEARSPELRATVATSDQLVSELKAATEYIFGVPMYKFSVPAGFKAYIDQIVIPGPTYRIDESGCKKDLLGFEQSSALSE